VPQPFGTSARETQREVSFRSTGEAGISFMSRFYAEVYSMAMAKKNGGQDGVELPTPAFSERICQVVSNNLQGLEGAA